MKKQELEFYRVEGFGSSNSFLANVDFTLNKLREEMQSQGYNQKNDIYYHWKCLAPNKFGKLTLKQIVQEDPMPNPIFYIYEHTDIEKNCKHRQKYGEQIVAHQNKDEEDMKISVGENGHVIFDARNTAILASSVNYASNQENYFDQKKQIKDTFHKSMIEPDSPIKNTKPSIIKTILQKLGIISREPSPKNLHNTIKNLKKIETKQQFKEHINRQYSDYDPKFATYLQSIYLKFAILSAYRLHYVQYQKMEDSIIPRQFDSKSAKIGIIGDFGTGLPDSIALLKHLILVKGVDIILHLGDVYYAGTPHQYDQNVTKIMEQLRVKAKRQILFYSIPGNHDYYSWGLPYLCFIKNINSDEFARQTASYFCLRSQNKQWQFIGLDTAYHDSNPANQINGASLGPSIRAKEVQWFEDKMQTFPGSTILLTHHQLFSIHQRLCGSFTSYRHFSCINPLLSAQLFKYIPHLSGWFWGHEHSYMLFADGVAGAKKCRLLGNSSFHVFSKQNPYIRKQGFPTIPFITEDQQYYKKYLPIDPKLQSTKKANQKKQSQQQHYYNLCYALIDFSKSKPNQLPIQYYCCPCFCEGDQSNHFKPYLIYNEVIQGRAVKEQFVAFGDILAIKSEIGLFIEKQTHLTLGGSQFIIKQCKTNQKIIKNMEEYNVPKDYLCDGDTIAFMLINKEQSDSSQKKQKQSFLEGKQFVISKKIVLKDTSGFIKYGDSFTLRDNSTENQYLCCQIGINGPYLGIDHHECLFMFVKDSKITDLSCPYKNSPKN